MKNPLTSILSPRRRGRRDKEALSLLWVEGERGKGRKMESPPHPSCPTGFGQWVL